MNPYPFFIDKITNSIEDVKTGEVYETEVLPFTNADLKLVLKKYHWNFNWMEEQIKPSRKVFKLVKQGNTEIQGIISIEIMSNYLELHLIEVAPHNYGRNKKYYGVAANLVAFACKMSFDLRFEGTVSFTAKTKLIQHYINTLGAELIYKNRMKITFTCAKKLVNSYYKNYFHD